MVTDRTRTELETAVLDFVRAEVPPPRPRSLGLDTELERDLRMIWEDVEEFLYRFFAQFDVNHAGFDLTRYMTVPRPLFSFGKRRSPIRPLTLRMLVDAAHARRWTDPA